mmetsp:Transcript_2455/g.5297  ORF Transcript_2455/g.5297 Transcript_2455/m.5297 type:complete len:133 (+) Transcript_2455:673-1071(+)
MQQFPEEKSGADKLVSSQQRAVAGYAAGPLTSCVAFELQLEEAQRRLDEKYSADENEEYASSSSMQWRWSGRLYHALRRQHWSSFKQCNICPRRSTVRQTRRSMRTTLPCRVEEWWATRVAGASYTQHSSSS